MKRKFNRDQRGVKVGRTNQHVVFHFAPWTLTCNKKLHNADSEYEKDTTSEREILGRVPTWPDAENAPMFAAVDYGGAYQLNQRT